MKVPIYSIKGKASKSSATLPDAFEEPVRLDLIRRAVRAARANRRQAYGHRKVLVSVILYHGLVKVEVWLVPLVRMEEGAEGLKLQILLVEEEHTRLKWRKNGI